MWIKVYQTGTSSCDDNEAIKIMIAKGAVWGTNGMRSRRRLQNRGQLKSLLFTRGKMDDSTQGEKKSDGVLRRAALLAMDFTSIIPPFVSRIRAIINPLIRLGVILTVLSRSTKIH